MSPVEASSIGAGPTRIPDHINKGVAIHISDQATRCLLHKERITPHSTTGPYRRVNAAGNRSPCFCKKPGGIGSI